MNIYKPWAEKRGIGCEFSRLRLIIEVSFSSFSVWRYSIPE